MEEKRNFASEIKVGIGENRTEPINLDADETSSMSGIKKMQKGSSVSDSSQTTSVYSGKNEKERRLVNPESRDKERRLSFLSVFKFHRRKSVKEVSQDSDSDCDADVSSSHPPEKSNDSTSTVREFPKVKREELCQDTGAESSVEAGAVSKVSLDESQKKAGRWQHVRTRLQHAMALPNKPEVNLSLDLILAKKKSIQRKQLSESTSVKMHSPSKPRHADNEQADDSLNFKRSPKHMDNSLKVFQPQKISLQSSSSSPYHCPSEDAAFGLDSVRAQQMKAGTYGANHTKAAHGGKGLVKTSSEFTGVEKTSTLLSPIYSPHSKESRKPDRIILDQKMNKNRNVFQAFIPHRRVLKSATDDEQDADMEGRVKASTANPERKITRHLSQLQISYQDGPNGITDNIENGTVYKSLDDRTLSSYDCSIARIQKKAASLPDLINCNPNDNVFVLTNINDPEMTNVLTVDTRRHESKLMVNQNSENIQNMPKKKRLSLAAYRDKTDLNQRVPHGYNHTEDDLSAVIRQRVSSSGDSGGILRRRLRSASGDRHTFSSTVMFARKSHGDVKKSAQKVLDSKKDLPTRLKHFRIVLESFDATESKAYFEQNFSVLYFLFHEGLTNVETNLGQRVSKGHREELDFMLLILEKILVLLPDLIHKRWHLCSIGRIMKKLLHPGNSPKLKKDGLRLFVMWYEILMDNATEDCHRIFKSLIPRMTSSASFDNSESESFSGTVFPHTKVIVPDISPLLPSQAGEVQPDQPNKWLLECLLASMVSEVSRIQWNNSEMHEYCLKFLFDKFKDHYLPRIFPDLVLNASIYEPCQDLSERILCSDSYDKTSALCQESVIKWIAKYTLTSNPQKQTMESGLSESNSKVAEPELVNPGSNASTLSMGSSWVDNSSSGSLTDKTDESFFEREFVRNVFYSSKENINIIHEVFRQVFLCPFQIHRSRMVRQVINVYRSWFQNDEKPIFMREPKPCRGSSSSKDPNKRQSVASAACGQMNTHLEFGSSHPYEDENRKMDVRAGLQRVLRVFITNSANLFMSESSSADNDSVEQQMKLEDQVDVCKKVLKMYRYIVTDVIMDKATWEQLLMVLLKIISTMTVSPTVSKENSLTGRIAESLFKTMMLAWVKANLCIPVSQLLWKSFTETLSSLTSSVHLIRQWSKTMELLTRIVSQCIYDVDLRDLPLDKLNRQKINRLHAGKNGLKHHEKDSSLSRNWLKQIMGGPYSRQRLPLALETVTSEVGFQLNSVSQQSRNKISCSKYQSQFDLSSPEFSSNTVPNNVHLLTRSNSDSNILIDSKKFKVSHTHFGDVKDFDRQPNSEDNTDSVFHVDTEETSPQSHVQIDLTDEYCNKHSSNVPPRLSVADSMSINSADSNVLPYNAMVDHSCDSSFSFNVERNSCSDYSDTEALLRVSDSGSIGTSSGGVYQKSKFRSLSESNSCSKDIVLAEADEGNDDAGETEEGENLGRDPAAELQSIKTTNESVDDDDIVTVLGDDGKQTKQDGDSLQMEEDEAFIALCADISQVNERQNVVESGGHVSWWTPDVALVLWQRMLGCLGNVNNIKDSYMHKQVFDFLSDLLEIFIKIRENQGITKDNQITPMEPTFVPPILLLSSWCFEALKLPDEYKSGKLVAYQMLCTSIVRRHDVELSQDHLQRFFLALHYGLVHSSQEITNVLIRYCNSKFFSQSLPGSTLMMLDFVRGAQLVLSEPIYARNVPRAEAMSVLGSLLCFQNHLKEIPVLDPDSRDLTVVRCSDIKDSILDILLKFTRNEPPGHSQCIAVNALGLYLYEELCHSETLHPKLKDAFDVLLSVLLLTDKAASLAATHVLVLLCDHVPLLLLKLPDLPCAVVKDMTKAITCLLPAAQISSSEESKKTISHILISVMFALLEWCMRIPQIILLSQQCQNAESLLHLVFDALNIVVNGGKRKILDSRGKTARHSVGCYDQHLDSANVPFTPVTGIDVNQEINFAAQKVKILGDEFTPSSHQKTIDEDRDSYGLKSAARVIIFHLINYLNHFPMSAYSATQMNSDVEEYHDTVLEEVEQNDLSAQMLASNNTQFFVINNTALISFVEIPLQMVDQTRLTNGLSSEKTVCRIISRDPSGKHCWDSSVLYGNRQCRSGSSTTDSTMLLRIEEEQDIECREKDLDSFQQIELSHMHGDQSHANDGDVLDLMLRYLSESSPECLLHYGEALNAPFHTPIQLSSKVEECVKESLSQQPIEEKKYLGLHMTDRCMTSKTVEPLEHHDPLSPFQLCRLFLSQFGFITNEKRKRFDLLHKSEKLLRELKHLDNQRCRDTHKIAVIYISPGQEDKVSILKNSAGSSSFNEFVAALGWQVNLESHSGFMGGLQRNQTTGSTAPYYTTSTKEVIFHVSTQMPSETEEDQLRKLIHLGNDEVHIIWSEHKRDYRHGIIPTKFGDVLIVIYPLENGLFRIQIIQRPEVPSFGPLFDGAIVNFQVLPGLVRATAISAGQMLRTVRPHYQAFYEERMHCINDIVSKYKMQTTFEVFSSQIFAPCLQMDNENISRASISVNKSPPQPLTKVSKGEQLVVHRKLSLAGGKLKKPKKMQSTSTSSQSPSFDRRQIR